MNKLNILTTQIVNSDNTINETALVDLLELISDKIDSNIFNDFSGRKLSTSIKKAETNYPVSHGLNFIPNFAIIIKQVPETPSVTFNFNKFTNKDIYITTDDAVSIDVLVGRLDE